MQNWFFAMSRAKSSLPMPSPEYTGLNADSERPLAIDGTPNTRFLHSGRNDRVGDWIRHFAIRHFVNRHFAQRCGEPWPRDRRGLFQLIGGIWHHRIVLTLQLVSANERGRQIVLSNS